MNINDDVVQTEVEAPSQHLGGSEVGDAVKICEKNDLQKNHMFPRYVLMCKYIYVYIHRYIDLEMSKWFPYVYVYIYICGLFIGLEPFFFSASLGNNDHPN